MPVVNVKPKAKFDFPEPPLPLSFPYRGEWLRWAIEVIGWDINQCADRLGMHRASLRQMLKNRRHTPDVLGIWIEALATQHLSFPKPMGWDQRRTDADEDGMMPAEEDDYAGEDDDDQNDP